MKFSLSTTLVALLASPLASAGTVPPPSKMYNGDMRYFTPGLGSCGKTNSSSQNVVALSAAVMQNPPNPNANPICGQRVTITYKGISAKGAVVDTCPTCPMNNINVSPKIFKKFAPLSNGVVTGVTWHFNA